MLTQSSYRLSQLSLALALLLFSACNYADNNQGVKKLQSLPAFLTLEFAIKQANGLHPTVLRQRSVMNLAKATLQLLKSKNAIKVWLDGRLRYVEPLSIAPIQSNNDSQVGIIARKRLYDFGQTRSRLKAANLQIRNSQLLLLAVRDQHKIRIMQAFFSVLLADLAYARDNEAMATAYVSFDKIRHRNKLGQISDIDLLKSESLYQQSRSVRYASDVARRITRSTLANSLNRPGQLSANLTEPAYNYKNRKLPEVTEIINIASKNNPRLLALKAGVEAAKRNILAAKAGRRPILEAEVGSYEYKREFGFRDKARASINIRIPLFNGGQVRAEVARYTAIYYQKLSDLRAWQLQVRQTALVLRQALYVLRARRDAMDKLLEYRELSLDKSRALYELDVRKTLGDAMVNQSAARYDAATVKYQLILTWARLNLLQGKLILSGQTVKNKVTATEKMNQE